jgi:hypothetical protein
MHEVVKSYKTAIFPVNLGSLSVCWSSMCIIYNFNRKYWNLISSEKCKNQHQDKKFLKAIEKHTFWRLK